MNGAVWSGRAPKAGIHRGGDEVAGSGEPRAIGVPAGLSWYADMPVSGGGRIESHGSRQARSGRRAVRAGAHGSSHPDPYARLIDGVKSGFVVGAESLDGIHVYHLAFTEAQADWQIWIQDSRQPLPMWLTVTYTDVPRMSSQRVSSTFENWNVDARVSDA